MTTDEAIKRLVFHAGQLSGSFLGMLRPYSGLRWEVLTDVRDSLRACSIRFSDDRIPRELVSALWAISRLGRLWALDPNGMLRRNRLISDADQVTLSTFLEKFDLAVELLLQGSADESAFRGWS